MVFFVMSFEVFPCLVLLWLPFPVSVGSSEVDYLFKVFQACPDHAGVCQWDCCCSELVFALLLALEVLCHGEGVIEFLIEGVHYLSDFTGFDYIVQFFHVVE